MTIFVNIRYAIVTTMAAESSIVECGSRTKRSEWRRSMIALNALCLQHKVSMADI
ncbi:hypothetical protein [Desulfosporosinus sp.]|uniref:hypothetical protein n=1 Tax=Desulfosporosinus sp. TaxID=157907 RepID=UPI0025B9FA21|nr:hypothetical protein [Desulfosporosinus sp.]MBC2727799.1 hypothetical protein [Desulfosporosinus sp.]